MFNFATSPLLRRRTNGERIFSLFGIFLILFCLELGSGVLSGFVPGTMGTVILASGGLFEILSSVDPSTGVSALQNEEVTELISEISEGKGYYILDLFSCAWTVALVLFAVLVIERRSLFTLGIEAKKAGVRYAGGFLIGGFMFASALIISLLSRAASFDGLLSSCDWLFLLLSCIGFLIQGAAEEFLVHGFLMTSLCRRMGWFPSVLIPSVFFTVLHFSNNGVGAYAVLNLFLFSFFVGLFVLRTGNIIGAAALHGAWNIMEGPIFGLKVSGTAVPSALFQISLDATRSGTNGGDFGPEGGLAVTLVLMIAIAAVLLLPAKENNDSVNL